MLKTTNRPLLITFMATAAFALGFRFWHILWGLPFNYDANEQSIYETAVFLAQTGHLDPQHWLGPSALAYVCSVPVYALHWLAGIPLEIATDPGASPGMIAPDQWSYLVAGRILVALLGATAAVVVAWGMSRLVRGAFIPLIAGFALAALPLHIHHSHIASSAVPTSFAIAVALAASFGLLAGRPVLRNALLAGAAVGLASGFDPVGVLGVVPVVVAIAIAPGGRGVKLSLLVLSLLTAAAVFVITTPMAISDPGVFASGWVDRLSGAAAGGSAPMTSLRAFGRQLLSSSVVGPVVFALALAPIPLVLLPRYRRQLGRATVVVFSLFAAWLLFALLAPVDLEHLAVALSPALAFSVGFTLAGLSQYVRAKPLRLSLGALVAVVLVPTALAGGHRVDELGLERTETLAHDWFVRNVPPGARIVRDWQGPQLPVDRFNVLSLRDVADLGLEQLDAREPDFIIVTLPLWDTGLAVGESSHVRSLSEPTGVYRHLFDSRPAAAFCPVSEWAQGPEIWIFARSQRARRLVPISIFHGDCVGPSSL